MSAQDTAKAGKGFLSLETGERLCDVYDAYRACFPPSDLSFEQQLLLARGLAQGDAIALEHCTKCEAATLIDRLGLRRHLCSHCQRLTNGTGKTPQGVDERESGDQGSRPPDLVQQELF